ncbi:uncharacterized protein LOC6646244 [Drosophila willistoni]|uniref:uncharacterized protein LOC6646244 n=1 Tax=Drosophila willistoni TaxID=7260 RepID=UPI000C26CCD5|nr:uncharacterized protein LOC6646244 [Drosophila willistoni]
MCIHCCRLRHAPCPPIPYACPHCPVHEIASACSVRGRKQPDGEHMWYSEARKRERYKNPCVCHTLPPRWLDINRNVIFELARRLQQSPEATHYMLLRLLHANYGKVMRIMKRRRSYDVPLSSQALFFSPSSLIDENGNLFEPMHPESVEKLLRLIQDYLHRMQLLNRKYKWFNNGLDKGDLMGLLVASSVKRLGSG